MLLLRVPDSQQRRLAASLFNAYPGSSVKPIAEDDRINQGAAMRPFWCSRLNLSPDVLPLRLHPSFVEEHSREAVDPVEAILEQVKTGRSGTVEAEVWLHVRPASRHVRERASKYAVYIDGKFPLGVMRRLFLRCVSSSRVPDRLVTWLTTLLAAPGDVLRPSIVEKLSQHLLQVSVELRVPAGGDPVLVADGVLSAFARVFAFDESQAPRMMYIFRNALLTLVEMPDSTLLSNQILHLDPKIINRVMKHFHFVAQIVDARD